VSESAPEILPRQTLDRLAPGESAVVAHLDGDPVVVRRLMELGLVPGTPIAMVRMAPLGDPLEVSVRGIRLSLRRAEAGMIRVTPR